MTTYAWNTVTSLYGESYYERFGGSIALNTNGTILAVGSKNKSTGTYTTSGRVKVYQNSNDTWNQIGSNIDGGEADGDLFGSSVALSSDGTILAVGAPENDGNGWRSGSVRVYQYSSNTWTQLGSDIDGESSIDSFGTSVALSSDGTILAASAIYNSGGGSVRGSVRVYQYSSGSWTQIGSDIDGEANYDQSGFDIEMSSDGTILAISSLYNDGGASNAGSVRVYKYSNNSWTKLGSDIDGASADEYFGTSLALSSDGTVLAVGAPYYDKTIGNEGRVVVYQYSNSSWTQIGSNITGDNESDKFGFGVSLTSDGTTIAVMGDSYGRVFQYSSGSWTQIGQDLDTDMSRGPIKLNSDGTILAVSNAYANSTTTSETGKVKILELTTGSSYSADMTVSGGSVTLPTNGTVSSVTSGYVSLSSGSTITTLTGGDVSVSGDSTVSTISSSTSTIKINSGKTLTVNSGTHSGTLSGSGSLTKTGSGTLTLGGSNSGYSGSVNINSGKATVTSSSALGSGSVSLGTSSNSSDSTLEISTSSSSTLSNNISIMGSGSNLITSSSSRTILAGTITKNGTTVTLGGSLSVSGGISGSSANSDVVVGTTTYPGDVTYSYGGSYTYNGPTTVTAISTLTIESGVSIPNSDVTIDSGSILQLNYNTTNSSITVKSLVLNGTMIVSITSNLTAGTTYNILEYGSKSGSTTTVSLYYGGSNSSSVSVVGAFGDSAYTVTVTSNPTPNSDVCFPAKTPVLTNQGYINIEELDPLVHTIRNKKIIAVTKTVSHEKHLVRIAKNALGMNYPNKTTYISQNHHIFYKGHMIQSKEFVNVLDKVTLVPYNGEVLYNVLLKEHEKMQVNNLIVETLHPRHKVALLYCVLNEINVSHHHKLITIFNEWDRQYRKSMESKLPKKM